MIETVTPGEVLNSTSESIVSTSVHKYLTYSKKMQMRLAELNDNVSNVIKESCTGIDSICNKVRQCLNNMDITGRDRTAYLTDEVTEYEIIEEPKTQKTLDDCLQDTDEIIEDITTAELSDDELHDTEELSKNTIPITPFFSVLNVYKDEKNGKTRYCRKPILNKTIYSLKNKNDSTSKLESSIGQSYKSTNKLQSDTTLSTDTLYDNIELMNEMVENINDEITKFSETAIIQNGNKSKKLQDNKSLVKLKPIKRLLKINSRQKGVQAGDCLSETDVDLKDFNNGNPNNFLIADVYRKRAFTNIYRRLIAQVEANDSLIFFQTLMNRQKEENGRNTINKNYISHIKLDIPTMNYSVSRKYLTNSPSSTATNKKLDLGRKYADSLWFSQKPVRREKSALKHTFKRDSNRKKIPHRVVESRSCKDGHEYSNRNLRSNYSSPSRFKSQGDHVKPNTCSLDCTCRMVVHNEVPAPRSTKCQLQWLKAKPRRKLKFLDILDDLTTRDLLPIQSEYPRRDNQQPRELHSKSVQDTYLYKLIYGKQVTKNAWKLLLEPTVEYSMKNCCPVAHKNSPRSTANGKKNREEKNCQTFIEKFSTQNYSKTEVVQKLSRYLFDPNKPDGTYSQPIIVMPVRVYYDNFKSNEIPTKLKNTNKPPVKSTDKLFKRNDFSTPTFSKPVKVVYDGLKNKPDLPAASPHMRITKPIIINSARCNADRNQFQEGLSRSFSPKRFVPYCQDPRLAKKETEEKHPKNTIFNNIHSDVEKIKKEMHGKKSEAEKKLWANKYGKSVGQRLISFVQNQQPQAFQPIPKYATPKCTQDLPDKKNAADFLKEINPHRQMLLHCQDLKIKNEVVKKDIKKAIDVIETKMMDILCEESDSVEAFSAMEKEITNVLNLMKCNQQKNSKLSPVRDSEESKDNVLHSSSPDDPLENFSIISDQLFERLQRILDTGGSSVPSTPTDGSTVILKQPKKEDGRKKQKLSSSKRNKINIISPSTSASMEEKMISRRSARHNSKKERNEQKSVLSTPTPYVDFSPESIQTWENVCGDQSANVNVPVTNENSIPEIDSCIKIRQVIPEIVQEICDNATLQRSGGDFINPEDLLPNNDVSHTTETEEVSASNPPCNQTEEKLIVAEKAESEVVRPIFVDTPTTKIQIENLINEEINNIIDSIVKLGEQADLEKIQNEKQDHAKLNLEENVETLETNIESLDKEIAEDSPKQMEKTICTTNIEKEIIESSNYNSAKSECPEIEVDLDIESEEHEKNVCNFSEQVQKIIRRVEDIYSQLDDIPNSDSTENIPIFGDTEIPDVRSEIFLTPFMHAMKETRNNLGDPNKMALIEKSPSYYNVMNFLDSLSNMQKELITEIYVARLCHYAYVIQESIIYNTLQIWHEVQYLSEISSCLRKTEEVKLNKLKKVSFLEEGREDKSSQLNLCPYHKVKVLRISSQQFPPIRELNDKIFTEEPPTIDHDTSPSITEQSTQDSTAQDVHSTHSTKYTVQKRQCKHKVRKTCEVHGDIPKQHCKQLCPKHQLNKNIGDCLEKTTEPVMSIIEGKSTQVFCQMQKEENISTDSCVINQNECKKLNNSSQIDNFDCSQVNLEIVKPTEETFLDNFLHHNENIIQTQIENNEDTGEEFKDCTKHFKHPQRIVVFREVFKSPNNLNDIELYKRRLEKRREIRLMRKSSTDLIKRKFPRDRCDSANVVLLKSFYAIVYILMFTALSLDYRCL